MTPARPESRLGRIVVLALLGGSRRPWRQSAAMAGFGAVIGIAILLVHGVLRIPATASETLFVLFHPLHVFVASMTIARVVGRDRHGSLLKAVATAYLASVLVVTVTDSLLPYLGELLLALPSRHVHIGFVELWWIVHPAAVAGIIVALRLPRVTLHPLVILVASALPPVYDMLMAAWNPLDPALIVTVAAFVALSVWTYLLAASVASAGAGRRDRAGRPVGQEIGRWLSAVVGWSRD